MVGPDPRKRLDSGPASESYPAKAEVHYQALTPGISLGAARPIQFNVWPLTNGAAGFAAIVILCISNNGHSGRVQCSKEFLLPAKKGTRHVVSQAQLFQS